jgi:hypothetical protein
MKKVLIVTILSCGLFLFFTCAKTVKAPAPTAALTITPIQSPTFSGLPGTIIVTLDLGGGGAGFAATLYAQEVSTGKTYAYPMTAPSHASGAAAIPTSAPVSFPVQALGTYVFYAWLVNEPDAYHFGATFCQVISPREDHVLKAIDVFPGMTYQVYIAGSAARLPERGQPVQVPWRK